MLWGFEEVFNGDVGACLLLPKKDIAIVFNGFQDEKCGMNRPKDLMGLWW